jgi:tetratricopeptide (TPR) repeat protein
MYSSLLADCDDDAQLWHEAGLVADEIGDADAAAARLERAIELSRGDTSRLMAVLARSYMHAGRMRHATLAWIKLARQGPANTSAWAGVLVCALSMKHRPLADRASRVLKIHTSRSERRALLAELWRHAAVGQQITRIADGDYEYKATQHSPVRSLLARAAQTLEAHGTEHPQRADTHYHHAMCLYGLGNYDQAEDSLVAALEINPQYADALRLAQAQALPRRAA